LADITEESCGSFTKHSFSTGFCSNNEADMVVSIGGNLNKKVSNLTENDAIINSILYWYNYYN
jgi:hypothetical protein